MKERKQFKWNMNINKKAIFLFYVPTFIVALTDFIYLFNLLPYSTKS